MAPAGVAGVGSGESGYAGCLAGLHTTILAFCSRRSLVVSARMGRSLLSGGEDPVQEGKKVSSRL